ncbi:MAG: hypothetical protein GX389_03015 [Clostridiaceae bacterium]|jgi:hypothetical protein|nr:hypothetical protein [Clostridiaceae bacterium]
MTGFFTCIILIGSGLVVFSFFLLLYEKKRLHDYRKDLRERKEDIVQIIEDAEELITEINRFSEYTVNQIEEKNQILTNTISDADLRIELLQSNEFIRQNIEPSYEADVRQESEHIAYDAASVSRIINEDKSRTEELTAANKGKILTFDIKRREIIKLAKSGLDSTEIARILNCGKGEIELIARMGR